MDSLPSDSEHRGLVGRLPPTLRAADPVDREQLAMPPGHQQQQVGKGEIGIGEAGATSLSLIVDDLGVYYDATRPSRLEHLIANADDWCDAALTARARGLIDRIVASGVSKTNMGGPLDASLLKPGRRVLIVDQTFGDASIAHGLATAQSFDDMIAAARRDEPDAQLIVKRHPAVAAGRKRGCVTDLAGVTLVDTDVRPADLLAAVDAVYCVTSALGFEALMRGLAVRCFGAPF